MTTRGYEKTPNSQDNIQSSKFLDSLPNQLLDIRLLSNISHDRQSLWVSLSLGNEFHSTGSGLSVDVGAYNVSTFGCEDEGGFESDTAVDWVGEVLEGRSEKRKKTDLRSCTCDDGYFACESKSGGHSFERETMISCGSSGGYIL